MMLLFYFKNAIHKIYFFENKPFSSLAQNIIIIS